MAKVGIEVEGLKPVLNRMNKLGKEANRELRAESKGIATAQAGRIQSAARSDPDPVTRAVGVTVRARSDRIPSVVGGGGRRLSALSGRPRLGDVFFGAEFGGGKRTTTRQFRDHKGKVGYWFWPQIRKDQDEMLREWTEALQKVIAMYENGSV